MSPLKNMPWIPKTPDEVYRRAAGRRKYHAERRRVQAIRRGGVLSVLIDRQWEAHGIGRELAQRFKVDASQISRDIHHITSLRSQLLEKYGTEITASVLRMMFPEPSSETLTNVDIQEPVEALVKVELLPPTPPDTDCALIPGEIRDEKKDLSIAKFQRDETEVPVVVPEVRKIRKIRFHWWKPPPDIFKPH